MPTLFYAVLSNYDSYTLYQTFTQEDVVDNLYCVFKDDEVEAKLKYIDANRDKTLCFQIGGYMGFLHVNMGLTMFSFIDASACSFEDILQDEFVVNRNFNVEEIELLKDCFHETHLFRAANEIFQPVHTL